MMFEDKIAAEAEIKNLIAVLLEASCESSLDGKGDYSEDSRAALHRLGELMPVWGIEVVSVDESEIDRRSNLFGGKPFTSTKHPWPKNIGGRPYYPLIQIDLRQVSKLAGRNFGDGLAQVWLDITKDDLNHLIRVVDGEDLIDKLEDDAPSLSIIREIDESGYWFGICLRFEFKSMGYMMAHWFDGALELNCERDLSDKEVETLNALEKLSEDNGYGAISGSWLLGYPGKGGGSPAGRYFPEPKNFIQFSDSRAFPMIDVSRYANIFFSDDDGEVSFFFDWNG